MVGLVQLMGKTLGDGFAAKGAIRHKEPLLCAQGALGRWLVSRFTIQGEAFPSPTSEEWRDVMLRPARDPTKPMTYQNHKSRLAALYGSLEIMIENVTHACRIWAARFAEEAGLSDVVSMAEQLQHTCILSSTEQCMHKPHQVRTVEFNAALLELVYHSQQKQSHMV